MENIMIPVKRYDELIRKELVYDIKKTECENNEYASDHDKMLFGVVESISKEGRK